MRIPASAMVLTASSDILKATAVRLVVVAVCAVCLLPGGPVVVCIAAGGHVEVELPHGRGTCDHAASEAVCDHHSHEHSHSHEAPHLASGPCGSVQSCTDLSLDRPVVSEQRPPASQTVGLAAHAVQWHCPADELVGPHVASAPACRPQPPPPDRTVVLLI